MQPKLDFDEVVSILPCDVVPRRLWGAQGVVVGRASDDRGAWAYAVQVVADENRCWQIEEQSLRSEGRSVARDEIDTGERITVHVDPATGRGSTAT